MKQLMRWGALLFFSSSLYADCTDMVRSSWRVPLKEKKVVWLATNPTTEKICSPLIQADNANIKLTFTQGKQKFERSIFVPTTVNWDQLDKNGKLTGGEVKAPDLYFDSLIPTWAKKAQLVVTDIQTGKTLAQGSAQ